MHHLGGIVIDVLGPMLMGLSDPVSALAKQPPMVSDGRKIDIPSTHAFLT